MGEIAELLFYDDPFEYEPNEPSPSTVTCKYCGMPFLQWYVDQKTNTWRLYDSKRVLHSCEEYHKEKTRTQTQKIQGHQQ